MGAATDLGPFEADVNAAVASLSEADIVRRIWRKDHTVWKQDPGEITDRLGWLTIAEMMTEQAPVLEDLADQVREAGFRHVVLLGMGGSSLGAEVLRQVFDSAPGFPELIVLDSILPASVKAVSDAIDPVRTLFLVSSKSGTTTEPNILYRHFKQLVRATGKARPGGNFMAITDAGTPLAALARQDGFRTVLLNSADMGGRFSVLSYFGLVPAALMGIDIRGLLDRAVQMSEACASSAPGHENPGLVLGASLGALGLKGADKLTLFTSPLVSSFGLWVEQLVAESTGKEGKGIVPIIGEPAVEPPHYGQDRQFVYLRLKQDDNSATDSLARSLIASGRPVRVMEMADRLDLGAEFFRWEFATAVAGAVLGINPFDQPDVQRAKEATERLLAGYVRSGVLPPASAKGSVADLLSQATPGSYLAVMAYLRQTPRTDAALATLRQKVLQRHGIATTLGYGPRFLHSTGQLHKGGPNKGLFLQVTESHEEDLPVPGEPYTFGVVADAQALGDLEALRSLGRRAVSIKLSRGGCPEISSLTYIRR